MEYRIEFAPDPDTPEVQVITDGLLAHAAAESGASGYVPVTFFARNEAGTIVGGVSGNTGEMWLYVSALWVAEGMRGRGIGSKLMDRAERLAIERGCTGAYLDTLSDPALAFYHARGYREFGRLPFSAVRTRYFLRKDLVMGRDPDG